MFLQYAIWGAWSPVAQTYLQAPAPIGLGASGTQVGLLFFLLPFATILMPPLFGNLADRYFRTDRLLAILHLLSALALLLVARQSSFKAALAWMAVHALLYAPTLGLSNSLVFSHLEDPKRHFTPIRLAGTIGWGLSGVGLTIWRSQFNAPAGDLFLLASILSVVQGVMCFLLPKTPPAHQFEGRFAFGKALKLLKQPNFMFLTIVGLVASSQWDFYYQLTGGFLSAPRFESLKAALPESYHDIGFAGLGIPVSKLPAIIGIGQVSELVVMLIFPFLISRIGIKWILTIGLFAWPMRYALFMLFPSSNVALLGLAMHGLCTACFIIAGFIYAEQIAPPDVRASAQALMFLTFQGIGRGVGALFAGYVQSSNVTPLPGRITIPGGSEIERLVDWQSIFAIPTGVGLACALIFPFVFRTKNETN